MKLTMHPLTPDRWPDLEAIFNAKGCSIARQCWCRYYRRSGGRGKMPEGTSAAEFNKSQLRAVVASGPPPGLIGYLQGQPVGWVSLGRREDYGRLAKSPVMKPVDGQPVWSSSASSCRPNIGGGVSPGRCSMARSAMRASAARNSSRRTRSIARCAEMPSSCGSAPRPCTTPPGSRKWHGASRSGRSSA